MNLRFIDEALDFYDIDKKYKAELINCINDITRNEALEQKVKDIYDILYIKRDYSYKELWKRYNIEELFGQAVNPFITNLILILGYNKHLENINNYSLDANQIQIHKKRVKACFCNDIEQRGYRGIRISQMLWGSYFVNIRLLEVGVLQFENAGNGIIKIHIPAQTKLFIEEVKNSIFNSKEVIEKYFKLKNITYICDSWLLSKELNEIISEETNINKFYKLFDVQSGLECNRDLLNFVYKLQNCDNYNDLAENTSLQKIIKKELIQGTSFKKGIGTLN